MLRSLLLGVLAFSTASACKATSDAPAVQPGVAVCKVVELSGEVSATRGTAKRVLATGQEISGDDTIATGAQANVRIVFAHNNATWELGPNRTQLVSESLAWKLPKQDTPASDVNEATLAAGRHAERETVTTTNTAPAPLAAPLAQAPAPGAVPESAAATPAPTGGGGGEALDVRVGRKKAPAARNESQKEKADALADDGVVERGPAKAAKRGAESAPLRDAPKPLAPTLAPSSDAPPPPPPPPLPLDDEVKEQVLKQHTALRACMKTNTLAVEVVVDKGVTTFVLPAGTPDEVNNCFKLVGTRIKFASSYTLRVKMSFAK